VIIKQVKGVHAQQGWPSVHAAFDRLCSYACGRTKRLSKMARQIIEDDLRADLTAPALGRTTAQKRSPRTASGTNQPDAALDLERPRAPTIGPRPGTGRLLAEINGVACAGPTAT
jgi:hypothetical protein